MQEVTVGLLKAAMLDHPESVGYLIDGFPRQLEQGEVFKQQVLVAINWENFLPLSDHLPLLFKFARIGENISIILSNI